MAAIVTFTEPVDLPRTLKTWGPKSERNPLPEDNLGRPIVGPVSDEVPADATVVLVMITLVGDDPGVWAFAKTELP